MRIKSPKDFWAGLMFIAFGLFFALWAWKNYQMGTAVRMGPAYFPTLLGGLMAVLGLIIFAGSFVIEGPPVPRFHFRPLLLIATACVAFGYLVKPLGLVLAIVIMAFVAALGGHEFRWKEVAVLSAILVIFSVLVFVKGLTLPFQLWPAAFG